MFQILVVEDDRDLNRTVCAFLNASGFRATGCLDVESAHDAIVQPDLESTAPQDCAADPALNGRIKPL